MRTYEHGRGPAAWISSAGAILLATCLTGCITGVPIAPHPTVVYVPHPRHIDPSLDVQTLQEMYAVSPNVDPDGLGAMDWIWDQSFLRLAAWAMVEKREELARVAYARTSQQHHEKLAQARASYETKLAFEGILIGDFAQLLDPAAYLPEGIYLVDDQGEKTLPSSVEAMDPVVARFAFGAGDFGTARYRFPRIFFPRNALRESTRSLSLYIAVPDRRIRFTWVFDPAYAPPVPESGSPSRRWRTD